MNLTSLIRNLENQLKSAESLTRKYDAQAAVLRKRLSVVARLLGKQLQIRLPGAGGRGGMSAAGRARIAAAQRRRWAKFHSRTGPRAGKAGKTHKMSAAGRARIRAAQKRRWAAFHQQKKA